jgi:SAM-dependent methyltransferase
VGFYGEQVLPRVQNVVMDWGESRQTRARVCTGLSGAVLEIGFGSGLNLPHLPPEVREVWAVDPSRVGQRLSARRRLLSDVHVHFEGADATTLPFDDDRFDAALSTWTMCTLPDPVAALREVARVLAPGGMLHFAEHGLAPDPAVARRQRRWDPVQKRVAGGCHLSRDIPGLLGAAGFEVVDLTTQYLKGAPKVLGHTYEGRARPAR